jgi:hypothetical protein
MHSGNVLMDEAGGSGEEDEEGLVEDEDDDSDLDILPEIIDPPKPTKKRKPPTFPSPVKRTKQKLSKEALSRMYDDQCDLYGNLHKEYHHLLDRYADLDNLQKATVKGRQEAVTREKQAVTRAKKAETSLEVSQKEVKGLEAKVTLMESYKLQIGQAVLEKKILQDQIDLLKTELKTKAEHDRVFSSVEAMKEKQEIRYVLLYILY